MFYLNLPAETKIGDTLPVKINGSPARVTWRDKDTLVIEPNDPRPIFHTALDGKLRTFFCGSAAEFNRRVERRRDGAVVVGSVARRQPQSARGRARCSCRPRRRRTTGKHPGVMRRGQAGTRPARRTDGRERLYKPLSGGADRAGEDELGDA